MNKIILTVFLVSGTFSIVGCKLSDKNLYPDSPEFCKAYGEALTSARKVQSVVNAGVTLFDIGPFVLDLSVKSDNLNRIGKENNYFNDEWIQLSCLGFDKMAWYYNQFRSVWSQKYNHDETKINNAMRKCIDSADFLINVEEKIFDKNFRELHKNLLDVLREK